MPEKKYFLTETMKQVMLSTYDSKPETCARLSRQWGVPRWKLTRWAQQLGVAHVERPWTPEEIAYLKRALPTTSLTQIGKKLNRTWESLHCKVHRLGLNKLQSGYTQDSLLLGFGCTREKVQRWMDKGWLKGERRNTNRTQAQGDYLYFSETAVRRFIRTHPEQLDPRRFDWLWVADLAFGDRFGLGELGSPEEVSS